MSMIPGRKKLLLDAIQDVESAMPAAVQSFAPPIHPDRVSSTTKLMCEAIDRIYLDTSDSIDKQISDFEAKVEDLKHEAEIYKTTMRGSADTLISQIRMAMSHYEDITAKLQESKFGKLLPADESSAVRERDAPVSENGETPFTVG